MRKIDSIILHCTATREGQPVSVEDVTRWHIARGFSNIGYHYLVGLDGRADVGRDVGLVGAHCAGRNKTSIGVCYVGGLNSEGIPEDTRTESQKEALFRLCAMLQKRFGIPDYKIHCHNEFARKACPCFSREQFMVEYKEWRRKNL